MAITFTLDIKFEKELNKKDNMNVNTNTIKIQLSLFILSP